MYSDKIVPPPPPPVPMNECSHFSGQTGDVACIDVEVRDLPIIALMRRRVGGGGEIWVWLSHGLGWNFPWVYNTFGGLRWEPDSRLIQQNTAKQLDISTRLREAACYKQECVGTSWQRTTSSPSTGRLQPRSVPHRALVGSVGQESEESCKTYPSPLPSSEMPWSTNGITVQWGVWMPWWIPWTGGSEQRHRHGGGGGVIHGTSETSGLIHRLTRIKWHVTILMNCFYNYLISIIGGYSHLQSEYVTIFFHNSINICQYYH